MFDSSTKVRNSVEMEVKIRRPKGLISRTHHSGATYYYLNQRTQKGGKRIEIPLGKSLELALSQYQKLTAAPKYIKHSGARLSPWVAQHLFKTCRSHAGRRKIAFKLTVPDVEKLLEDSGHKCTLTGIHFETRLPEGARFRHWMPSIDRIDCKGCYEIGNVRLVAMAVNIALSDFGEETLLHIARMLLRRRRVSL